MSIERVVAILTPFFGAVSAALTGWLGKHFPGLPNLTPSDVTALEIAGFTGAVGAALKWLHGRQKFVQPVVDAEHIAQKTAAKVMANQTAAPAIRDIEGVVKTHTDEIVDALGKFAPPTLRDVVKQMAREVANEPPAVASTSTSGVQPSTPAPALVEVPSPPSA